jgi:pilus assembly protein CpaB
MLAIALAVATGFMFTARIQALEAQIGDMQQVVVMKTDVPARSLITAEMLETREIPRTYAHASYIQSVSEVAGQRIAVTELQPGAILRSSDVAPTSGLNDGWRAISIGINPVSVQVDRVTPGAHVDVIVSYETTVLDAEGRETATRRTVILLQDVEVLAVAGAPQPATPNRQAAQAEEAPEEEGGTFGGIFGGADIAGGASTNVNLGTGVRDTVVVATLKVSPQDAQKLAYADTFASDIRLALRRGDDREIEPFPPVSEEDFR